MNDKCPIHDEFWKTIPAGISKRTGKAYNSFQACPIEGCKEKPITLKASEPIDNAIARGPQAPEKAELPKEVDWDSKERRMVRMNVLNRATDLIVADKLDIKDLEATVDKLETVIYKGKE